MQTKQTLRSQAMRRAGAVVLGARMASQPHPLVSELAPPTSDIWTTPKQGWALSTFVALWYIAQAKAHQRQHHDAVEHGEYDDLSCFRWPSSRQPNPTTPSSYVVNNLAFKVLPCSDFGLHKASSSCSLFGMSLRLSQYCSSAQNDKPCPAS